MQVSPYQAPIKGLRSNVGGTLIEDTEMPDCQNVFINNYLVTKRYGYVTKGLNLPLNGEVMRIDTFVLSNGTSYEIVSTTDDFYVYDSITDMWDFITPTYTTGTASATLASTTVNGAGAGQLWLTNVAVGDKIGFGTTDANAVATWYTVASVTNDGELEMTAAYTDTSVVNTTYCIRKLSTGTSTDMFFSETMSDTFVVTNGVDTIKKWTGTGVMTDLSCSYKSRYIKKYKDYLVLGYTIEAGTDYPQRLRWCDTLEIEDWSGVNAGYRDLIEGTDVVTGLEILSDRLIAFKERSIYTGYLVETSVIAQFDIADSSTGCIAPLTIRNVSGESLIFMGADNIYEFKGLNATPIANQIRDDILRNRNPNILRKCHAKVIEEMDLYRLFLISGESSYPVAEYTYNYVLKAWTKGTTSNITAIGFYTKAITNTWDTLPGTWDSQPQRWNDYYMLAEAPIQLFGDSSGYIYEADKLLNDDNGTAVEAYVDTKDYVMQRWDVEKYWCRLDIYGEGNPVLVYYSIDEGYTWSTLLGTVTLSGVFSRSKIDFRVTSEKIRFRIYQNTLGYTFRIRMITLYWDVAGRLE